MPSSTRILSAPRLPRTETTPVARSVRPLGWGLVALWRSIPPVSAQYAALVNQLRTLFDKQADRALEPLEANLETTMALVIGKPGPYDWSQTTIDYSDGVTDSDDQIVGTNLKDHIYAGGGNDIIKGGGGADTIDGGEGHDGASYEDSGTGVQVSLELGKGQGGTAQGDTLMSIEDLYGSKYDDTLIGNKGDNLLSGGDGNDVLKGGGGTDVLKGGAGDDTMTIDGVEDHVYGGDGNDTLVVQSGQGLVINLSTGFIDGNPFTSPGDYFHLPHPNPYGPFNPNGP